MRSVALENEKKNGVAIVYYFSGFLWPVQYLSAVCSGSVSTLSLFPPLCYYAHCDTICHVKNNRENDNGRNKENGGACPPPNLNDRLLTAKRKKKK